MKGRSQKLFISPFKNPWHHAGGKHAESIFGEKGRQNLLFSAGILPSLVWPSIREITHSPNLPGGKYHLHSPPCPRSSREVHRLAFPLAEIDMPVAEINSGERDTPFPCPRSALTLDEAAEFVGWVDAIYEGPNECGR